MPPAWWTIQDDAHIAALSGGTVDAGGDREKGRAIDGVTEVKIDLVWEPPWDPSKMSEAARLQLGMM